MPLHRPASMSSAFVRTQLERALERLAASPAEQLTMLTGRGFAPCADELALELDDFVVLVPAAVHDGALSEEQASSIQRVHAMLDSLSGEAHAWLWDVDQLDSAWQWSEVRRLAREAPQALHKGRP